MTSQNIKNINLLKRKQMRYKGIKERQQARAKDIRYNDMSTQPLILEFIYKVSQNMLISKSTLFFSFS